MPRQQMIATVCMGAEVCTPPAEPKLQPCKQENWLEVSISYSAGGVSWTDAERPLLFLHREPRSFSNACLAQILLKHAHKKKKK